MKKFNNIVLIATKDDIPNDGVKIEGSNGKTFVALKTEVYEFASSRGIDVLPKSSIFLDADHAVCVKKRQRLFEWYLSIHTKSRSIKQLDDNESLILLRVLFKHYSDICACIQITEKFDFPMLLNKGKIEEFESRDVFLVSIIKKMYPIKIKPYTLEKPFKIFTLYKTAFYCRKLFLKFTGFFYKSICSSSMKLTSDLISDTLKQNPKIRHIVVSGIFNNCLIFLFLLKNFLYLICFRKHISIPLLPYKLDKDEVLVIKGAVEEFISLIEDSNLKSFYQNRKFDLEIPIIRSRILRIDAEQVLKYLRPNYCINYDLNQPFAAALAQAAKNKSIKNIIVNHNPFTFNNQISKTMIEQLLYLRAYPDLSDIMCVISFQTYKFLLNNKQFANTQIVPIRPRAPVIRSSCELRKPLILHAGSYTDWKQFFPNVFETVSEYLNNLNNFSSLAREFKECDFEIRIKYREPMISKKVAMSFIKNKSHNLVISDAKAPFIERLAACTLLVSFNSTCIEEALRSGIPVLLYGPTQRYMQLNASEELPTAHKRYAVYYAKNEGDVLKLLAAIIKYHFNKPLTAEEVSEYLFDGDVKGMREFANTLVF